MERKEKMDKGHAAFYDEKYGSRSDQYIIKISVDTLIEKIFEDKDKLKLEDILEKFKEAMVDNYDESHPKN